MNFNLGSQEYQQTPISINTYVEGNLVQPEGSKNLVILIAGSGPIDRDGNQNFTKNAYLKKLAYQLAHENISSFRFDKRIVSQIRSGRADEGVLFDDFVTDVKSIITFFKSSGSFDHIYLLGHAQGSLVGLLALTEDITGFISINGSSKNIGDTLIEQVAQSAPELKEATVSVVNELKNGRTTLNYPKSLDNAFNLETQAFLISWMAYEPKEIISKLSVPGLIIHGSKDLQLSTEEGKALYNSCESCKLVVIENMNHMLFEIFGDELENYKSYSDPNFQISKELIGNIVEFIAPN
jgi:hypothetical protein